MSNCTNAGRSLWAHRGALAQQRKYPGREYTIPGIKALALYRTVSRLMRQWIEDNHPDVAERINAMAIVELAREESRKSKVKDK